MLKNTVWVSCAEEHGVSLLCLERRVGQLSGSAVLKNTEWVCYAEEHGVGLLCLEHRVGQLC